MNMLYNYMTSLYISTVIITEIHRYTEYFINLSIQSLKSISYSFDSETYSVSVKCHVYEDA